MQKKLNIMFQFALIWRNQSAFFFSLWTLSFTLTDYTFKLCQFLFCGCCFYFDFFFYLRNLWEADDIKKNVNDSIDNLKFEWTKFLGINTVCNIWMSIETILCSIDQNKTKINQNEIHCEYQIWIFLKHINLKNKENKENSIKKFSLVKILREKKKCRFEVVWVLNEAFYSLLLDFQLQRKSIRINVINTIFD